MNWLIKAGQLTNGSRWHHANGATDNSSLITENIPKEIAGYNNIKLSRTNCQLHSAIIYIEIIQLHILIILSNLSYSASPQTRGSQYIGLIYRSYLATTNTGCFKGQLGNPLYLWNGVILQIPSPLSAIVGLRLAFLTEINTAYQLTNNNQIYTLYQLLLQRRVLNQSICHLHWTQICI